MPTNDYETRWLLARLARRRRQVTIAALNGTLTAADAEFLRPHVEGRFRSLVAAMPSKRAIFTAMAVLALLVLCVDPAFAGGSGLEVEAPVKKGELFFINVICPLIGIAGLVIAGVTFISSKAQGAGSAAIIFLGVAFVGFAVPMAASAFNLTSGALIPVEAAIKAVGLW